MNITSNYGLKKPTADEKYTIDIFNTNVEIIDSVLKSISDKVTDYTETDPTVPSWAKQSSKPSYTKSEVGLGNVDNTSDANKPVSTAQQTAINTVLSSAKSYTDTKISDLINGASETMNALKELSDAKADKIHTHGTSDIIDLQDELHIINNDIVETSELSTLNKQTLGYTKKNLLKNTATSKTINGITFTVNSDGSVTANGTTTQTLASLEICNDLSFLEYGKKYILSGVPNAQWCVIKIADNDGKVKAEITDTEPTKEFTYGESMSNVTVLVRNVGTMVSNATFYPMIRDANITDDTYEPYKDDVDTRITQINSDLANCASKSDILILKAGSNITITPNADTNEITISSASSSSGNGIKYSTSKPSSVEEDMTWIS